MLDVVESGVVMRVQMEAKLLPRSNLPHQLILHGLHVQPLLLFFLLLSLSFLPDRVAGETSIDTETLTVPTDWNRKQTTVPRPRLGQKGGIR